MKKHKFPWKFVLLLVVLAAGLLWFWEDKSSTAQPDSAAQSSLLNGVLDTVDNLLDQEPEEVQKLREQEVAQTDAGHQEYYFSLLDETGQRVYREMLTGIRARETEFYLSASGDSEISTAYDALLKDHPELFWIHNREKVYTTYYEDKDYCRFAPGYSYTEEQIAEIEQCMENAYQEVCSQITSDADTYEKVRTVYAYLIDLAEYVSSEDDQNVAGIFWKKQAVCAGYARAVQYLLERLDIPVIYVEGDTIGSEEGHAWNIVKIDEQYYYVDATNGDQPQFLEGDAVSLAEHKTILYDYLCPFPDEYEQMYIASDEFAVPECTATDCNFYVRNQGCFDTYDADALESYCRMRLDNGAAVVRFKFSTQEAFEAACNEWINSDYIQNVAMYYMEIYGIESIQYHYGILDTLKTIYIMF